MTLDVGEPFGVELLLSRTCWRDFSFSVGGVCRAPCAGTIFNVGFSPSNHSASLPVPASDSFMNDAPPLPGGLRTCAGSVGNAVRLYTPSSSTESSSKYVDTDVSRGVGGVGGVGGTMRGASGMAFVSEPLLS